MKIKQKHQFHRNWDFAKNFGQWSKQITNGNNKLILLVEQNNGKQKYSIKYGFG